MNKAFPREVFKYYKMLETLLPDTTDCALSHLHCKYHPLLLQLFNCLFNCLIVYFILLVIQLHGNFFTMVIE